MEIVVFEHETYEEIDPQDNPMNLEGPVIMICKHTWFFQGFIVISKLMGREENLGIFLGFEKCKNVCRKV